MLFARVFLSITAAAALCAAADAVKVDSGQLKGSVQSGVLSFKGVPFAQPPVGDLRWRAPQPVKPWSDVRDATSYGADCMQLPFPSDAAPLGTEPSEDCLFVNVWRPANATKKLAVIVWLYGGGFVNGGSSPAVYDGSAFARRGVVFVSFNYRLGRFGSFAHPALSAEHPEEAKGNYGYMDQLAGLRWVQRNISAFGGNAKNVTVFGESAGGGSVHMLMTSPMAKGLFQKAIVESGGGRGAFMPPRFLNKKNPQGQPSAEEVGVAFAKAAGITGEGAEALAALRKLDADAIVAKLNMATMMTPTYTGPIIDGKVVLEMPDVAYKAGRGAKTPFMAGANSNEFGGWGPPPTEAAYNVFGANKDKAKAAYDPTGTDKLAAGGIGADQMMVETARFVAKTLSALGQPVYEYRFSYVAESMRKEWGRGAPHATEIPFVFDTVEARYGKDLKPADKATAEAANAYWVNFAKTGNPNGKGLPVWPAYKADTDQLMDFSLEGPQPKADPWKARLDLVEALAEAQK